MRLMLEALRDLRVSRIRSFLTGITLFVGVVSIVAVFTVGSIVRDVFVAAEEQRKGRAVTIGAECSFNSVSSTRLATVLRALDRRVVRQGASYALQMDGGAVGAPGVAGNAGGGGNAATFSFLAGRLDQVRRLPILQGRWLSPDHRIYPAELIVNQAAADQYGGVGESLSVQPSAQAPPLPATIVGVIADGRNEPDVYASMNAMLAYRPTALRGGFVSLFVHHPTATESELMGLARAALSDAGVDPADAEVHRYDGVEQLVGSLRATQRAFLAATVVLLIVAVIGLLNIGLASVRERMRELVIRRAVGATRARVAGLVLLSGITIALIAALLAVGVAIIAVTLVVPRLLDPAQALHDPQFPWSAALIGVGIGIGAALSGGLLPAIVAARIDVAYALRD